MFMKFRDLSFLRSKDKLPCHYKKTEQLFKELVTMKFLSAFIKEDWQGWRPNLKNSRDWSIAKNTSTFLKLMSTYIDDVKKTSF